MSEKYYNSAMEMIQAIENPERKWLYYSEPIRAINSADNLATEYEQFTGDKLPHGVADRALKQGSAVIWGYQEADELGYHRGGEVQEYLVIDDPGELAIMVFPGYRVGRFNIPRSGGAEWYAAPMHSELFAELTQE